MEKKVQKSREEIIKKIMESMGKDGVHSRTLLVGEAGIGKTWIATEVSKLVTQETQEKPSSYNVLWLHLNKKIGDEKSLYQNIAAKLSYFPEYEEGEEHKLLHDYELDASLAGLKEKIGKEFISKKQNLLLILEDEGRPTTEEHVMKVLKLEKFLKYYATLKTLVIHRRDERKEDEPQTTIEVCPLTEDESEELLRDSQDKLKSFPVEKDWPDLLKSLCDNKEIKEPTLMSCIASKSKGLPAAIVVLAKTLNRIKPLSMKQKKIFKELILSPKSLDEAAACKNAIDRSRYNPVLRFSYELLKPEETDKSPVIACFWHIMDFYKYSGCAYYRDLIVHWMLEGYFDPVKSVEKAYQQGHSILMEFMNRGILKIQEDNVVVPEVSMSNLLDLEDCGFFGRSCLGFDRVYGGDKTKGLGRIIVIDDMIKTTQSKDKKIRTLIVSGNRLCREVAGKFFEKPEMEDLEVVVLFEPTFHKLIESLSKLKKLRVLVIRDCDQIRNIDIHKLAGLNGLHELHVLEVSGACYLDTIPDDFFKYMTKLESLNFSGLAIKSSPSTIENLSKLRCFILRDCSELQDLPNFNVETRLLEVIDIRGARKLESYFDRVKDWKYYKGKNKNFAHLQQLEHLDFSESRIIRLPIFHTNDFSTMKSLKRILIRNCVRLKRLPQLRPLTDLQILDASGSTLLVEMLEVCLEEKKELRILNMSDTGLPELADTIADVINLNQLLLKNCTKIQELPSIEKLIHLEVFDVSGCDKLKKIDGSFEMMSYLHEVNLSGTDLSELPKGISELPNIEKLIIRNCSKLKTLPNLEKLIHLEIFDVSGCTELEKIDGSFEMMSYLHEVNLSGTDLSELPKGISELPNIEKLIIRNCSKLKTLPNLEKLIHLEIFDVSGCTELEKIDGSFEMMSYLHEVNLSGTDLSELPKGISELPNIEKLIIRNCSKLKTLPNLEKLIHLEIFDVSGCTELEKIDGSFEMMPHLQEVNLAETKLQTFPELPKQSILCSSKRIVLADSKPEGSSSADVADNTLEKGEELVYHGKRYKVLDYGSPSDIIDINKSMDLGTEVISKAEYISISENDSASLSPILDKFESVKGCWVERCKKMENLFESNAQQEKDKPPSPSSTTLESLWISNLPLLKSLHNSKEGFVFKNLKKLSIDCCPSINFLFPKGSPLPDTLETLRVTFCDNLERLFEAEEGELSNLRKLYLLDSPLLSSVGVKTPKLEDSQYTVKKCPNWKAEGDELRLGTKENRGNYEVVQPHKIIGPEAQTSTQPTNVTGPN